MSQTDAILADLQKGKSLTPIDALRDYGCFRLGARIYDLRRKGYPIEAALVTDRKTGKTYASYSMGVS